MKINAIKANGVEYDIWATESDVQALNNQGNAAIGAELQSGKQLIAQAINANGGEASEDESLAELAESIATIPVRGSGNNIGGVEFQSSMNYASSDALALQLANLNVQNPIVRIDDYSIVTIDRRSAFTYFNNLLEINLHEMTSFVGSYGTPYIGNNPLLQRVYLPKFIGDNTYNLIQNNNSLKELIMPLCAIIPQNGFSQNPSLETLQVGTLTTLASANTFTGNDNLKNLIIGAETSINLSLSTLGNTALWNANVDADEWNLNFRNGVIANLHNYSGGTAHSITLGSYAKAKLTQETIDMANAKGWNIL